MNIAAEKTGWEVHLINTAAKETGWEVHNSREGIGPAYLEKLSKARTCEKGFVFIHSLQTKAHLAFVMTWRLMSSLHRRKLIDRLGKNDWLVRFHIDQLTHASGIQLEIQF